MEIKKCSTCRKEYSPDCDWNQGRCPHHPPVDFTLLATMPEYYMRYLDAWGAIKNLAQKAWNWIRRV
jgi:hypothetical protein